MPMNTGHRSLLPLVFISLASAAIAQSAEVPSLANMKAKTDLDATIATTRDAAAKSALQTNAAAILAAAAKKPHVDSVIAILEKAAGSYEKINTMPEALKQALGADAAVFDTLKVVNLGSSALGIKGKRETDPFDHAFYEHLGQIPDIESLTILHTTAQNADLVPVANLVNLKNLNITNQSKLNDEGLAHLAGLKNLERFSFVGTSMTGQPFKDFEGWTKLTRCSFRGSKIDDEGLKQLCAHFPNLESLVLAHANFTDAAAIHLATFQNLKGFEIGTHLATTECLRNIVALPIEYLQLGEQLGGPAGIAVIKDMKTLRRLTITSAKDLTDADVAVLAGMAQLEHLELGSWDLTDERLPMLRRFSFLKSMRLVRSGSPYTPETRARVQSVLPKVALQFD